MAPTLCVPLLDASWNVNRTPDLPICPCISNSQFFLLQDVKPALLIGLRRFLGKSDLEVVQSGHKRRGGDDENEDDEIGAEDKKKR